MDPTVIAAGELVSDDDKSLSLKINPDRLKFFFHMMHGENNTRSHTFDGAISIDKIDIIRLVKGLFEQLNLIQVTEYATSIGVGFSKEFVDKPFSEFVAYEWNEPDKTTEITIKINFLFEGLNIENPIKHAIYIRIAKGLKPANLIQILAAGDSDSNSPFEGIMSPVLCRTDHVNDKLSKDIMRVVEDWHGGLTNPPLVSPAYDFLKKHRQTVAQLVHYSMPASAVFIMCYFAFSVPDIFPETKLMAAYVSLVIGSQLIIQYFINLGRNRANKVYGRLSSITNSDVVFDITKGDDKQKSEALIKNQSLFNGSLSIFLWTNAQAISASIIAAIIFERL